MDDLCSVCRVYPAELRDRDGNPWCVPCTGDSRSGVWAWLDDGQPFAVRDGEVVTVE